MPKENEELLMDDFARKLMEEYGMPEAIAEDCAMGYTHEEKDLISRFLARYCGLLKMPYERYGKRK